MSDSDSTPPLPVPGGVPLERRVTDEDPQAEPTIADVVSLLVEFRSTLQHQITEMRTEFALLGSRLGRLETESLLRTSVPHGSGVAAAPAPPVPPEGTSAAAQPAVAAPSPAAQPVAAVPVAAPAPAPAPAASTSYVPPHLRTSASGTSLSVAPAQPSGPVPLARSVQLPLSSFDLAGAAEAWSAQRTIKLPEFARLGRGQGELPYARWQVSVLSASDAARLSPILLSEYPASGTPLQQEYYRHGSALLFHSLLTAVSGVPILCDQVSRIYGDTSAAFQAWSTIRAFYVRLSEQTETHLLSRLPEIVPRQGESMEAFLNRIAAFQTEFLDAGLELRDSLLIPQVLSHLSAQWRTRAGVSGSLEGLTWPVVAQRLLAEDTVRRQSDLTSREALLPLGFPDPPPRSGGSSSGGRQGGARPAAGSPPPRSPTPGRPRPSGSGGRVGGDRGSRQPGSSGSSGSRPRSPSRSPSRSSGSRPGRSISPRRPAGGDPLVCWHCHRSGHRWDACPTRPSGWRPTAESRAEGLRLSAQRGAQSRAAKARACAARSGGEQSSAQGRSPSPARGRSPTRAGASSEGHASGSL